jgi:streptogramin lyase
MRTAAFVVAAAVAVGCGSAAAVAPPVRLVGKPPPLVVGQRWRAVLEVRDAVRPSIRARLGSRALTFPTVRRGPRRYEASVRFPAPGRWRISAVLGRREIALARVVVGAAGYALALPAQLLVVDGAILIAERQGRDRVLRVDPATGSFTVFGMGIPEPFGIARATDGSFLVSSEAGLYRLPRAGGRAERLLDTGTSAIAVAPDGHVYFGHGSSLGRIDIPSRRVETFPIDVSFPHGLALAPDGALVVTDTGNRRVIAVDPTGSRRTVLAAGLRAPVGLTLEPSGVAVVAEFDAGTVLRISPSGERSVVASGLVKPYAVDRGPDGTLFVVEAGELHRPTGRLRRVAPDGSVTTLRLVPE